MPQPLHLQPDRLVGTLRHLLPHLSKAQLCLVFGWTEKQLEDERNGRRLHVTRAPHPSDTLVFDGDPAELLATVRHHLERLPVSHLVLLKLWVQQTLEER